MPHQTNTPPVSARPMPAPSRKPPCGVPLAVAAMVRRPLLPLGACRVAAGFPSPATDHIDHHLDLTEYLALHPQTTFYLRVKGDSMIGAGIHDDDLLIVDRSLDPASGRVVVAALNGGLTVKRLHRSRGHITLKAENPVHPDIPVSADDDLQIWGVVTHVVHKP